LNETILEILKIFKYYINLEKTLIFHLSIIHMKSQKTKRLKTHCLENKELSFVDFTNETFWLFQLRNSCQWPQNEELLGPWRLSTFTFYLVINFKIKPTHESHPKAIFERHWKVNEGIYNCFLLSFQWKYWPLQLVAKIIGAYSWSRYEKR
jgi:hypothetical protein